MTPNHNHNHNPHHRHMLGSPLFDPNNLNGSQDNHQNPNLAQIMNMMQSPAPGMPPQFNPYRQHQSPHQRFPYGMNPAVAAGYPAELMRFQAAQQQQPPRMSRIGGPPGSQFYGHSPVSSPEEMRKRAAQVQAQQAQQQQQQAQQQQQQQGYFPYPPDPSHLAQSLRGQNGGGSGFFQQHQQQGSFHQQFNSAQGPVGEQSMPSMPPLPQSSNNQFGGGVGNNNNNNNNNNFMADQQHSSNMNNIQTESSSQDHISESSSPEKSSVSGAATAMSTSAASPEKSSTLESIVNSLTSPNGPIKMPSQVQSRGTSGGSGEGGEVDLTPLGTILNSSPEGRGRGRGGRGGSGRGRGGRGRGRGRGRGKRGILSLTKTQPDGTIVPIDAELDANGSPQKNMPVYYTGSVSLGLEEDQYWLSELQVYLRSNFAEAFGATERDIAAPMHGRNKPIALGQVGIRCIHCKDEQPTARGQQAVSYPSLVSGIYNSVQQMFRLHFDCCTAMPAEVKAKIETLRASSSSRGGRKQYWIDSAKRLGLVDTPHGIHFGRDPTGPLPPLSGPSAAAMIDDKGESKAKNGDNPSEASPNKKAGSLLSQEHTDEIKRQKEEAYPLVLPEDQPLISEYLYLTLQQMEPCKLMDADRVGCYKGREMGFRGLACKWCVGQAGCGRYFPASEASLSQTTTSQTILNHVRNCRRCPSEIRDNLEVMKKTKMGPDGKKYDKPKHGGRKVFFHRLWCRIQGLEIEEIQNVEVKIGRQKGAKNKVPAKKRKKRKKNDSDSESDSERNNDDDETETEDEEDEEVVKKKKTRRKRNTSLGKKRSIGHIAAEDEESSVAESSSETEEPVDVSFPGCVPLSKLDDTHWLSDLQCFIRSDLVEVFSVTAEEAASGHYEEDVDELQVGIRCKFCDTIPLAERPEGHCYFPHSISAIQSCVSDLHRRHFSSCNQMPEDVRKSFKSLRGFTGKAEGETQQYWIDSARELGLSNAAETSGIRFYRKPTDPSPAEESEKERNNNNKRKSSELMDKKSLVRPDDIATNHAMLLLKQVRPCRFKTSDRRGGPGSRGRDRALGFPGVACIHCSSKSNFGRYFPFAAKSLGDNTFNSINTHIASCSRCPQAVKSSLAFLSHRGALEKAELGGGWKKSFFKAVWDRLHIERAWTSKPVKENLPEEESFASEDESGGVATVNKSGEGVEGNAEMGDESLDSEIGEMVKAAAQWLTDRDADNDTSQDKSSKTRAAQRRGLPGRGLPSRFGQSKGAKRQKV